MSILMSNEDKKLKEAFDDVFRYHDYGCKVSVTDDCCHFSDNRIKNI